MKERLAQSAEQELPRGRFLTGICLTSMAILTLELYLIQVFAIVQSHHFAFLVVSIGLFGIAAAGTVLYLRDWQAPAFGAALSLAVSAPIALVLLNRFPFDPDQASANLWHALPLLLYYLVLGAPFLCGGLIVAQAFRRYQQAAGRIYAADLGGAAMGSVLALVLFACLGERTILGVTALGLAAALCFSRTKWHLAGVFLVALLIPFLPTKLKISPDKELPAALRWPGAEHLETRYNAYSRVDVVRSSMTRYAPGASLGYLEPLPDQLGLLVNAGNLTAITKDDPATDPQFVRYLPAAIGPELAGEPPARILVMNSGGGLEALTALAYGHDVVAYEPNSAITNLLKGTYRDFSGNLAGRIELHTSNWRGREDSDQRYEAIVLGLAGNAAAAGVHGLGENYLLTREALAEYEAHLSNRGVLVITRWLAYPPRETLRLFSLALTLDPQAKRTAMFRSLNTITLVIAKEQLDTDRLLAFTERLQYDIVYLPAEFTPNRHIAFAEPYYAQGIGRLLNDRQAFYEEYLFDVGPVSDARPFYAHFFKPAKWRELYAIIGESWQPFRDPGFLLIVLLVQASLLSLVFICLPLAIRHRTLSSSKKLPLVYFFGIGLGYLFVEIALIKQFVLVLDNISYSAALVIMGMLLFSSLGSRWSGSRPKQAAGWVALLLPIYVVTPAILARAVVGLPLAPRLALTLLYLAPLAFAMGRCLPAGIQTIEATTIPWAWAVNGTASVLSPILAIVIALAWGYPLVMASALACYLLAAAVMALVEPDQSSAQT